MYLCLGGGERGIFYFSCAENLGELGHECPCQSVMLVDWGICVRAVLTAVFNHYIAPKIHFGIFHYKLMKHFYELSKICHRIIARSGYSCKFNSLLLYPNANAESLWRRWAHHLSAEKFTCSQCAYKSSPSEQLYKCFWNIQNIFYPVCFSAVLFRYQIHTSGPVSGDYLYFAFYAWYKTFTEFIRRKY